MLTDGTHVAARAAGTSESRARSSAVTMVLPVRELDMASAPDALQKVRLGLPTTGGNDVVRDLGLVQFLDAAGIGEIVRLRNERSIFGGRLYVERWSPTVGRVLAQCGLLIALSQEESVT